jgi:hypothetical protein
LNRKNWQFPYSADAVRDAAAVKRAFHAKQREDLEADLPGAEETLFVVFGEQEGFEGKRRVPALDPESVKRFEEAERGILLHGGLEREFEAWECILTTYCGRDPGGSGGTLLLDQDDLAYFGLDGN